MSGDGYFCPSCGTWLTGYFANCPKCGFAFKTCELTPERVAFIAFQIGYLGYVDVKDVLIPDIDKIVRVINGANKIVKQENLNVTEREIDVVLGLLKPFYERVNVE